MEVKMDKRMEIIIEKMGCNPLGLDDTFQFRCRACGKCCKNRDDIILTTRDLCNIAQSLSRTTDYVIERYCELYIGSSSRVPIVRLKPGAQCPLLMGKKCVVHDVKPVVCALYPLGRAVNIYGAEPSRIEPIYIIQSVVCGLPDQTQSIREWLERSGIPIEDPFYIKWNQIISLLAATIEIMESLKISEGLMERLWGAAAAALYYDYDAERDFMNQFAENTAKLKKSFEIIRVLADKRIGGLQSG
jgi:Fe-S-cluster containining protein